MPFIDIQSDDARPALFRHMSDVALMRDQGLFVAEGRLVVERVIADGRYQIHSVLVNPAAARAMSGPLEGVAGEVPVYVCPSDAFVALTGYNIHRGCLALVRRPALPALEPLVAQARTVIVLEGVANPDNIGGIFRNAAAFGADAVVLGPGCGDPLYRKAIRTSMGAVLRVPFATPAEWPGALDLLRGAGFTLFALTPREPSETIDAVAAMPRPGRLALIAGTEGAGLSEVVERTADRRVRISLRSGVDSLNVSVALAVALHRFALP